MEIKVYEFGKGFGYTLQCMQHNEQIAVKLSDENVYRAILSACRRGASKWNCKFYTTRDSGFLRITRIERRLDV